MRAQRCSSTWRPCPPRIDGANAPFRLPIQRVIRPDQQLPRLRRADCIRLDMAGRPRHRPPFGQDQPGKKHHHLRWRSAAGRGAHVHCRHRSKMSWISAAEKCLAAAHQAACGCQQTFWPQWSGWTPSRSISGKTYLLKHTSQTVKARVRTIQHRVNMQTLEPEPAATLELNSIGVVEVETTRPLFLDHLYSAARDRQLHPDRRCLARDRRRRHGQRSLSGNAAQPRAASPYRVPDSTPPARPRRSKPALRWRGPRNASGSAASELFQAGVVVLIETDAGEVSHPRAGRASISSPSPGLPDRAEATAHLLHLMNEPKKYPIEPLPDEVARKRQVVRADCRVHPKSA